MKATLERQILRWLANGKTGRSSKTMAFTAIGIRLEDQGVPRDPADFNRCLLLVEQIPMIKEHFPKIAALSGEWAVIINDWDDLERTFLQEAGRDWAKCSRAPETWALMKTLR